MRRTIDEFHLDVQVVLENGQEKLLFEGTLAKRWLILKLLDDDYLGSTMTHEKYEVNSKRRRVTRRYPETRISAKCV